MKFEIPQIPVQERIVVDLHNPTPSTRTVHDGIGRYHVIEPGQTLEGVVVLKLVAIDLENRTRRLGRHNADVRVKRRAG